MAMLEIKDLQVYYGVIQAIKGISFTVNEGEIIALIGANGAGKTTILHTISGLIPAKPARSNLWIKSSQKQRRIKLCRWAWRTCRKAAGYSRSFLCTKT